MVDYMLKTTDTGSVLPAALHINPNIKSWGETKAMMPAAKTRAKRAGDPAYGSGVNSENKTKKVKAKKNTACVTSASSSTSTTDHQYYHSPPAPTVSAAAPIVSPPSAPAPVVVPPSARPSVVPPTSPRPPVVSLPSAPSLAYSSNYPSQHMYSQVPTPYYYYPYMYPGTVPKP